MCIHTEDGPRLSRFQYQVDLIRQPAPNLSSIFSIQITETRDRPNLLHRNDSRRVVMTTRRSWIILALDTRPEANSTTLP
jgi:hypothetical protein